MSVGFVPAFLSGVAAAPKSIPFWDDYRVFAETNGIVTSSNFEGPTFSANQWDVVILDGKKLPGICKAHGQPTLGIDKKGSKGRDGLVFTVNGYVPGPIEIESKIWTPDQWLKWQEIIPSIWRRPTTGSVKGSALAISIYYPSFDFAGITQVIIVGLAPPEKGDIPQSMIIKLKALEYLPPGAVNTGNVKPKPNHPPVDKRIPALNAPPPPSAGGNGLAGPPKGKLGGAV